MLFHIYSKKNQHIIRIICLIAELILCLGLILNLIKGFADYWRIALFIENCIVALLILFLFFFPTRISLIAIIAYQYSVSALVIEPMEMMALYMFSLALSVLLVRGFFKKHKFLKLLLLSLPIAAAQLSEIRFGSRIFFESTANKIAHSFVLVLIVFFLQIYFHNKTSFPSKKLNLANYPGLKKRDAEWLCAIQQNKKYEWIAIEYEMSTGSVKNRLKAIFDVLEVGDKTGFLNSYADFEICYEE